MKRDAVAIAGDQLEHGFDAGGGQGGGGCEAGHVGPRPDPVGDVYRIGKTLQRDRARQEFAGIAGQRRRDLDGDGEGSGVEDALELAAPLGIGSPAHHPIGNTTAARAGRQRVSNISDTKEIDSPEDAGANLSTEPGALDSAGTAGRRGVGGTSDIFATRPVAMVQTAPGWVALATYLVVPHPRVGRGWCAAVACQPAAGTAVF